MTHVLHGELDPPDESLRLPVVKGQVPPGPHPKQRAPKDPLRTKLWLERLPLFEVLEQLDLGRAFTDRIPVRV